MKHKKLCCRYDIFHMIYAILIILFSWLVFWNPKEYNYGFPVIFLLAALLTGNSGFHWKNYRTERPNYRLEGNLFFGLCFLFAGLALASAATVWG